MGCTKTKVFLETGTKLHRLLSSKCRSAVEITNFVTCTNVITPKYIKQMPRLVEMTQMKNNVYLKFESEKQSVASDNFLSLAT
jgi:hypothetical protein